jgi:hypothetical protein
MASDLDPALERLEPFVGDWTVEAFGGHATTSFEWTLDGRFLLQRAEIPVAEAPDALCVIAVSADGAGYTQHYFDSRGVVRLYAMTFDDGAWTLSRTTPDFSPLTFWQRFAGRFAGDGRSISGAWETCGDGSTWEHDFDMVYTKVA